MKKISRLVALVLAITMVVSMLPVFTSAEDEIAETAETVETVEAPAEAPAEEAEAPAEEAAAPAEAEAPAEEEVEAPAEEAPAEEEGVVITAAPEETAEEQTEAAEKVEEVKPEEEKKEEALPEVKEELKEELKEEEKEEVLVSALDGDEVEGTVSIASGSDYASFTRTFTAEDLTQKAAGNLIKAVVGSGAATYYATLTNAMVATEQAKTGGTRTITLLGDITLGDTGAATDNNFIAISGTNANWGNKNYEKLIFDLNGYTITNTTDRVIFYCERYGFTVQNGNIVYLTNSGTARSAIQNGVSTTSSATSGKVAWTPNIRLNNLTIHQERGGSGNKAIGSTLWQCNIFVDHCEVISAGSYAIACTENTGANRPSDGSFCPDITVTDSLLVGGASYPIYINKGSNSTAYGATISIADSVCVSNYASTGSIFNVAHTNNGGTFTTPGCGTRVTSSWSGTDYTGAAISGAKMHDIQSGWNITFDEDNGNTPTTTKVAYDANPTHANPTKAGYTFTGWSDGTTEYLPGDTLPTALTSGAITYTALWTEVSADTADVEFVNYNGAELQAADAVSVGDFPSYSGATPTKPCTTTTMYTFRGWTKDGGETVYEGALPAVTQADHDAGATVTYTAVYTESTTPWNYIAADSTVTGYENLKDAFINGYLADAANLGTGVNGTAGTIKLMADYTTSLAADRVDAVNYTNYVLAGITKNLTLDLNGHTLTEATSKRFIFVDHNTDGAKVTITSSNGKGTINKTTDESLFRFGGISSAPHEDVDIEFWFNISNVDVTVNSYWLIYSVAENVHLSFDNVTASVAEAGDTSHPLIALQNGTGWLTSDTASFDLSFKDTTLTSGTNSYIAYINAYNTAANGPASSTATVTIDGYNVFNNGSTTHHYRSQEDRYHYGMRYYTANSVADAYCLLDAAYVQNAEDIVYTYPTEKVDGYYTMTAAPKSYYSFRYVASDSTVSYHATLLDAFTAFVNSDQDGTIELLKDYTTTLSDCYGGNATYLMSGITNDLTIDLGGHTLTHTIARRFMLVDASVTVILKSTGAKGTINAASNQHFMYAGADAAGQCEIATDVRFINLNVYGPTATNRSIAIIRARDSSFTFEDSLIRGAGVTLSLSEAAAWDSTDPDVSFTLNMKDSTIYSRYTLYLYPNYTNKAGTYTPTFSLNFDGTNYMYYYHDVEETYNVWGVRANNTNASAASQIQILDPESANYACAPINLLDTLTVTHNSTLNTTNTFYSGNDDGGYRCVTAAAAALTYYDVSWDTDGDGVVDSTDSVAENVNPTHADPTKANYVFTGWSDGTTDYAPGDTLPCPTADVTYTAQYVAAVFSYVASNSTVTYYTSLVDAYTASVSDAGQGTINLLKDWTLDADNDYQNANHILNGPAKDVILDLNGYTLTNDSNRNLVYADKDGFDFTLKSTGTQGGYVQTNRAVSGSNNRNMVAIGGTSVGAVYTDRAVSITIDNVNASTTKGSLISTYFANPVITLRNSTFSTADVLMSIQASSAWTAETTSNPTFNFENVTYAGRGVVWCNRFTRGAAVLANMDATINLAGSNTFKTNNASYKNENGFRVYTRYEGDSAGQYDVESMIDPANGYVTAQVLPAVNIITLNGAEKDDGDYWTVTTSIGTITYYTISWDTDGDGVADSSESVGNNANPTHADPVKAGYVFTGWSDGTTTYAPGDTLPVPTADVTYTAQFSKLYFSYTAGDTTVTQYTTLKAAFAASEADGGLGTITMLDDYAIQAADYTSGSSLFTADHNVTLDFAGHTLTDNTTPANTGTQGANLFYVEGDNITITLTSSTTRATLQKSTERAIVCAGGTGSSLNQVKRTTYAVVNNVNLTRTTTAAASFTGYKAGMSLSLTNTTISSPDANLVSWNKNNQWDNTVNSTYALSLNNVTFTGKSLFYGSANVAGATCTATLTLAGTNSIKVTDSAEAAYNGLRYRGGSSGWKSLIDEANGFVVAQTIPYLNVITLNGETPDDGDYYTITTSIATGHTVTWHLLDGTTTQTAVLDGTAPTEPRYTLANLDHFDGWSLTDGGAAINLAEQTITANAEFYMLGTLYKSSSDFATEEDKVGYVSLQIGEEDAVYGTSFTSIMSSAIGHTATIKLYKDVEFGAGGETGCGVGTNAWNTFAADTDVTIDLNTHVLETVTNSEDAGFNRTLFSVGSGRNVQLTFSNGTLRANGGRNIIALGTTSSAVITNVALTATNVTFERTGAGTTTQALVGVYSPGSVMLDAETAPVRVSFTGCSFVASGTAASDATMPIDRAVEFNAQTTTGALPTTASFTNCSMSGVKNLVNFTNNGGTRPNVKIDAATVANLYAASQQINDAFVLDANTYTATPYELNPYTLTAGVYSADFEFVSYSMKLEDLIYPNFQLKNADDADFNYVTRAVGAATNSAPTTFTETNGEHLASISLSNLGFKAKDSASDFGIAPYKDAEGTRYMTVATVKIDEIVDATIAAVDGGVITGVGAAELKTAMQSMSNYDAWARYYYDSTTYADDVKRTAPAAFEDETWTGITNQSAENPGDPITTGAAGAYAASAVLGDQLYLKFYFYKMTDLSGATVQNVTDDEAVPAAKITKGTDNTGLYGTLKVTLNPSDYNKMIRVTNSGSSATSSIASYIKQVHLTQSDENVLNTAYAMLHYCEDVAAYFTAKESAEP